MAFGIGFALVKISGLGIELLTTSALALLCLSSLAETRGGGWAGAGGATTLFSLVFWPPTVAELISETKDDLDCLSIEILPELADPAAPSRRRADVLFAGSGLRTVPLTSLSRSTGWRSLSRRSEDGRERRSSASAASNAPDVAVDVGGGKERRLASGRRLEGLAGVAAEAVAPERDWADPD